MHVYVYKSVCMYKYIYIIVRIEVLLGGESNKKVDPSCRAHYKGEIVHNITSKLPLKDNEFEVIQQFAPEAYMRVCSPHLYSEAILCSTGEPMRNKLEHACVNSKITNSNGIRKCILKENIIGYSLGRWIHVTLNTMIQCDNNFTEFT